jgi:hypothetical protein
MMPIVSTIAIILLSAAALLLLIALLTPFHFLTDFAVSTDARSGTFLLSWIHPRILGMRYDFAHDQAELTIFWRRVKTFAGKTGAQEKTGKRAGTGKIKGAVKKEPVPEEPALRAAKPAEPAASASPEPFSSTATDSQPPSPEPSARSRFAQFGKRMVLRWRKFQATWRILQRHNMASRTFRWCMRLLSMSLRVVRFDHVRINIKAGIEDPAELGKIYGWYAAGNRLLFAGRKNITLRFEPQFMQNRLAFDGSVGLRTSAARVLMPVAVALVTFPWLRAFFIWRRLKTVYQSQTPSDIINHL